MSSSKNDWVQRIRDQQETEMKTAADKNIKDKEECIWLSKHFQVVHSRLNPIINKRIDTIQKKTGIRVIVRIDEPLIEISVPPSTKHSIPRLGAHHIELKAVLPSHLYIAAIEDHRIDRGPQPEDSDMSYSDWYGPSGAVLSETVEANAVSDYDIDLLLEWLIRTEIEGRSPGRPRLSVTIAKHLDAFRRVKLSATLGFLSIGLTPLALSLASINPRLADFLGIVVAVLLLTGAGLVGFAFGKWDWSVGQPKEQWQFKERFWWAFLLAPIFAFQIFWVPSQEARIRRRFDVINAQ
jgi:hypothetical protein